MNFDDRTWVASKIKALGTKVPRAFCSILFFVMALLAVGWGLDRLYPMDLNPRTRTQVILAENGTPLRAFSDAQGVWRYPVTLDQVSPLYIEALLGYEDRWFYHHPGVNPLSMLRAVGQWAKNGKIISGGSTLTMQVARLRRPVPRTVVGKCLQMGAALQLEWHFTKEEILTYYLNHAPFGGTFEGVQAACYAYFDHGAEELTPAQAALLAVMPQSPSRFRPDRFPQRAEAARNKCLDRLLDFGVWSGEAVEEAKEEHVVAWPMERHMTAPLLARRLHTEAPEGVTRVETLIDLSLQESLEQLVRDYAAGLPPHVSIAAMAMNNHSGAVEAYTGSADFFNEERFGYVDMARALRSPGSAVKPFIYGMALDQGLICSQSLLMDVPLRFGDYQPVNFHRSFSGPVSSAAALAHSLNLPAVQLMDHVGPRFFYAAMVNSGFEIKLPVGAEPNLSMALGGFSTRLEDLVLAYSSLGRGGKTMKPRFIRDVAVEEATLLSEGAAWIVQDMLIPVRDRQIRDTKRLFAIKTGTSYGFRDAWAIGVDRGYTLGVWVGRPDGTPVPGHYGAQTATPLLKLAFQLLPRHTRLVPRPDSVTEATICWPEGTVLSSGESCDQPRTAWLLDRTAPPTLTATRDTPGPAVTPLRLTTTPDGAYRLSRACARGRATVETSRVLWPVALESWLPASLRRRALIPPLAPDCLGASDIIIDEPIRIEGLEDEEVLMKKDFTHGYPDFSLRVQGGNGPWYWFENSVLVAQGTHFFFQPKQPGVYQILVVDQSGAVDQIRVSVFF
ncbi:penicillin-binding protein 1C [Desulfoluna sp.]|uniref:penicillin-binding protein 1C n=1 Tax=Desulfoluna sp. TaxID=2045199 RepID=UPI00262D8A63|nr:penicillin-binding protein 1C [Desulfoluna sp.]